MKRVLRHNGGKFNRIAWFTHRLEDCLDVYRCPEHDPIVHKEIFMVAHVEVLAEKNGWHVIVVTGAGKGRRIRADYYAHTMTEVHAMLNQAAKELQKVQAVGNG